MPADITVVIATFGNPSWVSKAVQHAVPSVLQQSVEPQEIIVVHGQTLARARNSGAQVATARYLVFLDADDELSSGYIESMSHHLCDEMTLLQPETIWLTSDGRVEKPQGFLPEVPLQNGNYLVIGTCVSRKLFLNVGGFGEEPIYEDWSLWSRCVRSGAIVHQAPGAVYRVWRNESGRNETRRLKAVWHERIAREVWG
jgi:glycosyltransferase involved in cell wall biosynthesis